MDLNLVGAVAMPRHRAELGAWQPGDAWLAGGTWLFSEPQPTLRRLVDLSGLGWPPLSVGDTSVEIAATCSIAQLNAAAQSAAWQAASLFGQCCQALLGSFKIWNMATVGGNICMALPAGPMTALAVALDAIGTISGLRTGASGTSTFEISSPDRVKPCCGRAICFAGSTSPPKRCRVGPRSAVFR